MTIATVITVTVAIMFWSLWIRRMTWKCSYEVAATFNITLQCLAVILMSPWASHTVGRWLYNITGDHNLEDYLAHDLYIIAASAIALNVVGKLGPEAQARFKRDVEMPATLAIPIMFLTFTAGAGRGRVSIRFLPCPNRRIPVCLLACNDGGDNVSAAVLVPGAHSAAPKPGDERGGHAVHAVRGVRCRGMHDPRRHSFPARSLAGHGYGIISRVADGMRLRSWIRPDFRSPLEANVERLVHQP